MRAVPTSRIGWWSFAALVACTGGGEDGSSSGGAGDETTGEATAPTSGTTAADSEATSESTGGGAEAGTTGGSTSLCGTFCTKLAVCEDPRAGDCTWSCTLAESWFDYIGPACGEVYDEYVLCGIGRTCMELATNPGVCADVLDKAAEVDVCTTDLCEAYADRGIECGLVAPEDKGSSAYTCSATLAQTLSGGAGCTQAEEAVITCQTTAACEELAAGTACKDEAEAADAACG